MLAFQYVSPVVYQCYLYAALMSVGSPFDVVDNFNPSIGLYCMYCKGNYDKHPTDRAPIITNAKTYACLEFHDNFLPKHLFNYL